MKARVRLVTALGLMALIPAAVGAGAGAGAAPAQGGALRVMVCGGAAVSIPLGPDIPGAQQSGCCAKGCRTGTRKRGRKARFDPPQ